MSDVGRNYLGMRKVEVNAAVKQERVSCDRTLHNLIVRKSL